jgi:hypothetical protein
MAAVPLLNGKVVDLTGPRLTARWGVTCTDLGASVIAPNGKLVSVFGPNYARQLWHYVHDDAATGWTHGGISTVIPSDLLRVDDSIYLHAIVNRGFVVAHGRGRQVSRQPARRIRPVLVWDYDPDDGWVCVVATGFQRDKGIILMRVRPEHIGQRSRYVSWASPTAAERGGRPRPRSRPRKHSKNKVAQLYGGYVLPGSRFDIQGGIGLMVSQWHTDVGWPYRAMQFKAALRDATKTVQPPDPINL